MAEPTLPEAVAPAAPGGGEGGDPMKHAGDYALFGVDAQGGLRTKAQMFDRHGEAVAGYEPRRIGPFKLEFTRHMLDLTIVAAILAVVVIAVARRVRANVRADRAPHGPLANAVEALLCFVRDEIVAPIGGEHLAPFAPLYLTYFFFILLGNLSGMIPLVFKGPMANLAVTGGLALTVLVFLTVLGIIRQGPVRYFLNLVPSGIPFWLWPMVFAIELIGSVLRCVVLAVRLFANMLAGHLVIPSILGLAVFRAGAAGLAVMGVVVGLPLALGVSLLEVLICLIQAYVFTMLSVIFTGAAVHPEH
jgi:F-type H+-transporting ATPase subunit a